ncbi:alkaline phosphatase family protein [Fimbriimonas ginsengisoli]|uniref:40-residue YVTN family beta-propeller repeat-containing protein n=1 Tax=Fimbriimonas ginsengisoli Gsoil 348 TaxID=661478 RepID=A0A068NY06_FIMGI|nr:alkaline phosphatase family protein [Fimbriimonas ginsengisoli]AIE87730.1 40-residue YVTN family beta-propeller repeat-containing protein [Fimbriimonas ginsengisoli Gsoil 348]
MAKRQLRTLVTLTAIGLLVLFAFASAMQRGVRVFLPSGWGLAPVGTQTPVGDMLAGGEASPNGKWIAFASVGQGVHKVFLLDRATGALVDTASIGKGWIGLGWSTDSATLYVSGGTASQIVRLNVGSGGKLEAREPIPVPGISANKGWLAGLAVDDKNAYIAVSASDKLLKIDLATNVVTGEAVFEDGDTPYQVRFARGGRLIVSLQGAAKVAEVDTDAMRVVRTIPTGRHPNDMLVSGERLFVACGNDDTVDVLDLHTGTREERILVRPWPDAPAGSTPHALAITPDGKRLYVANSDNNAVAVLNVERRGLTETLGFIPTAAYPCALATLADGKHLLIGSGKGFGTGPNDKTASINPDSGAGYPYIVTQLNGIIFNVDLSDPSRLRDMTKTVLNVSKYRPNMIDHPFQAPPAGSNPIPSRLGDRSPIKHVLYIIKENRTYDQVFGSLKKGGKPYGNGDPRLTLFGDDVAPNHAELARQYVLLDNLYASGEVSVDGHHWTNGAYVPDFMQRTWPQEYSGKGSPRLTASLAETPTGRIWDHVRRAGLSYRTYYYHTMDHSNTEWAAARAKGIRDSDSVDIFIREFKEFERAGTVPNFMVMALSEDHTTGTRPGKFTPKACVASNDIGIGKVVEAISSSSLWKEFAIFIIEDDAQNGADHVDSHRTVGLVVSPYTRNTGVDSTPYTTTSMLRTMELILGATPMTQYDAAATPMYRSFHSRPDLTPYRSRRPSIDITAKNPRAKEPPLLASIDFSEPDQLTAAQELALNDAIWHSVKGPTPYPGATRRFGR